MNGKIEVVDFEGDETPQITQLFTGRLMSSDYSQFDDADKKVSLHQVHVDLILDTNQYIQLLEHMNIGKEFLVKLVQ